MAAPNLVNPLGGSIAAPVRHRQPLQELHAMGLQDRAHTRWTRGARHGPPASRQGTARRGDPEAMGAVLESDHYEGL